MMANLVQTPTLPELRRYVHETLCHQNQLEVNIFEVTERLLVRAGRPCGILFCLHGPRAVKLMAVWETETNTILFYGSTGERMMRARLAAAPPLGFTPA